MQRKTLAATVSQIGPRIARFIISDGSTDECGEVVVQAGAIFGPYLKNPIVLFGHNPLKPVGTASNIRQTEGKTVADIEFAPLGVSKIADEVCGMVKAGIVKSASIGFDPVSCEPMDPARPRGPQKYNSWVLREISIVSLPANTNAVAIDKLKETATVISATPSTTDWGSMTKVERQARAAAIVARGSRPSPAVPGLNPAYHEHIQRSVAHCNAVHQLQRETSPTRNDRLVKAEQFAKKIRPAGY